MPRSRVVAATIQGLVPAEPLVFAVLQDAQQLRLQPRLEIPDLVEKDRPPGRPLETARPLPHRPREGAALVSKEFALDEIRRQGRAVHVDEGPRTTPRQAMKRAGDDPLPHAGLAGEQHRGMQGSDVRDLSAQGAHRRALTDELAEPRNARRA
jgi:hypothetical protein